MATSYTAPSAPTIDVLPNGVTLLNAPIPSSRNVGIYLIVRAGSRDEQRDIAGLAHYLEHLFFKGTKRRPNALTISREFDHLGAVTNAYTDTEEVAYYAEGPVEHMDQLADIITDMLSHPLFEKEEVERERNVVLQELSARLMHPSAWIGDHLASVAFGGDQPMAWTAGGYPSVIEGVSREQIMHYHSTFYSPKSMALVVSGGVALSPERAAQLVADVPTGNPVKRVPAVWGQGERYVANVRPLSADEEAQVELCVAMPGIPSRDPGRTPLAVATHILGSGMSSRLFHTVREREGLCYRISAGHEGYEDAGLFEIDTATRPKDVARAMTLAVGELHKLAHEMVSDEELDNAKASMIGSLFRGTETAGRSAHWYASRWRAGFELETPDARAEAIRKVTARDVQEAAERIEAGVGDMRLAFVGPTDQGEEILEACGKAAVVVG